MRQDQKCLPDLHPGFGIWWADGLVLTNRFVPAISSSGLHTRERDEVLGTHNSIPMSDVNTQVYVRKMEAQIGGQAVVNHGKAESAAKQVLKKLVSSQSAPYSVSRGKGTICAFYARGNCKRSENGGSCPFVHEMPEGGTRTRKAGASTSISKAPDAAAGEEPKTLSIKEAIAVTPAPAGSASDHAKYPSQNPNMLGTSTRSFRN
ncbi:RNA binding motif protein 22 [Kappamyces sp. JEL0680]|nr:RNA binding motif protein 22 [Kappamyces sp. JEL0680]